jgi:hypothetical protein
MQCTNTSSNFLSLPEQDVGVCICVKYEAYVSLVSVRDMCNLVAFIRFIFMHLLYLFILFQLMH